MNIVYKEWLPDQSEIDSDHLIVAEGVVPFVGGYKSTKAFSQLSMHTMASTAFGMAEFASGGGSYEVEAAGVNGVLYASDGSGIMQTRSSTLTSFLYEVQFAAFSTLAIAATGSIPMARTMGTVSNFATLASSGTALSGATSVGIINRFVMLGSPPGAFGEAKVQWSAIDDPRNWPTPNSATAIATQAGQQFMQVEYGAIQAIENGDQFGLIFQESGITRVTYVGPPVVFQFDLIDATKGLLARAGSIRVGLLTYFVGRDGFYVTDGVTVTPIGAGKVDNYFSNGLNAAADTRFIRASYDQTIKCVLWYYCSNLGAGAANNQSALCFHIDTGRWSKIEIANSDSTSNYISGIAKKAATYNALPSPPIAYNTSKNAGRHSASTLSNATITTNFMDLNPGGKTYVSGVKPLLSGATMGSASVALQSLNDLGDTTTLNTTTNNVPNSSTGFAEFRETYRYHKIRTNYTDPFSNAPGLEVRSRPAGNR